MGERTELIPCQVTIKNNAKEGTILVYRYFSNKREKSLVQTACSLVSNLIQGVDAGFQYTVRAFYNHHPMRVSVADNVLKVENFMGGRNAFKFPIPSGVTFKPQELKDYFTISGNNKAEVGRFFSNVHTCVKAKGKDRRKFLDGIYLISRS